MYVRLVHSSRRKASLMNKELNHLIDELVHGRYMMSETIFRTKLAIIIHIVKVEEQEKKISHE